MTSAERAAILIQQVGFDCENRRVAETIAAAAIDAAVAEATAKLRAESDRHQGNAQHWNVLWQEEKDIREQEVRNAMAEAKMQCESAMRAGLGMASGESLGDWLKRMQDVVNEQRERAVAEEREACAVTALETKLPGQLSYMSPRSAACQMSTDIAEAIRARGGRDADTQPTV